jgi:hypothetical protein
MCRFAGRMALLDESRARKGHNLHSQAPTEVALIEWTQVQAQGGS